MKFITMEHLRRFDSLAATWNDSYADKPRSALALAEKELLDQIFAASAMTGFAMRRLPEKFDEDEIFERRLLNEKTALQKGADDVMFPRYRYLTANCASLRFVKKAA